MRDDVLAYYRLGGETTRLDVGDGRLEFLRTCDVLSRTLPPAQASVLDVGGATGRYAGWLAATGYTVHVVDPVPEHVTAAVEGPLWMIADRLTDDTEVLRRLRQVEHEPSLLGASSHLLTVARRRR